jgi:hypothetical protein
LIFFVHVPTFQGHGHRYFLKITKCEKVPMSTVIGISLKKTQQIT